MLSVKVTTVGSSIGIVLPKEARERLRIAKGDVLHLVETKDGYELVARNPEFIRQMKGAEQMMRRFRNTFAELAK